MRIKKLNFVLGMLLSVLLVFASAVNAADVDMLHVLRPKSDLRIKIEAITNAHQYVDFITYHHDTTESSALLMEALRLAALRGVRVRYVYDKIASKKGSDDFSSGYLARLQSAGVEIRSVTLWDRLTTWGPFKLIHSKVLIADAGSGSEIAIMGGRNVGDRYIDWLDNTFVFRYHKQTAFGADMSSYFEKVWSRLRKVDFNSQSAPEEKIYSSEKELQTAVESNFGSVVGDADLQGYKSFMSNIGANTLPNFHFQFSEIRLVSSGMIDQVYKGIKKDEISDAFNEMAAESKKLEISTILFYLSKEKRDVVKNFLKSGGELTATTNHLNSFPAVLAGKKGTVATTLDKMQENEFVDLSKSGKVRAFVFNDNQFSFNHSKYVIGDKSVLLSSSNQNYASDNQAEENGVYIKNDHFTAYMKKYSENVREKFFEEADYVKGRRLDFVQKSCALVLKQVF